MTNIISIRHRRLLRTKKGDVHIFQIDASNDEYKTTICAKGKLVGFSNLRLNIYPGEHHEVSREELLPGLPHKWYVDHEIMVEKHNNQLHIPQEQLSPGKPKTAKWYTEDLLIK